MRGLPFWPIFLSDVRLARIKNCLGFSFQASVAADFVLRALFDDDISMMSVVGLSTTVTRQGDVSSTAGWRGGDTVATAWQ